MKLSLIFPGLLALCCAAACSSSEERDPNQAPPPTPPPPTVEPLPEFRSVECDHLEGAAAPSSQDSDSLQLSRAFALARWFGIASVGGDVDAKLVKSMSATDPTSAFASDTKSCLVLNAAAPLGAARVDLTGEIAIVRPGTGAGELKIPSDAKAIAIDLRDLAAGPELESALVALLPKVISGELRWPTSEEVHCEGLPDEVFFPGKSTYDCKVASGDVHPKAVGEGEERPLAVITGARLAPAAAEFALTLRLANRAWLVGENVMAAVAEATAAPGKTKTTYVRTHVLSAGTAGTSIPDVVPADHRVIDPSEWLRELPTKGAPPAIDLAAAASATTRSTKVVVPAISAIAKADSSTPATRASLIAAHAAVRTFFPYFGAIPDTWDAAFTKAIERANAGEATTARDQLRLLGEMGSVLEDGHVFMRSADKSAYPAGYAALDLDALGPVGDNNNVIVTRSGVAGIAAGDRLVSIGGEPIATRIAEIITRQSGSPGRRRSSSLFNVVSLDKTTPFTVEHVNSTSGQNELKTVDVPPSKPPLMGSTWSTRPRGVLTDLGASDTYYLSLAAEAVKGASPSAVAIEARKHRALVIDMRGYPGPESWSIAAQLLPGKATGCELRVPMISHRGEIGRDLKVQKIGDMSGSPSSPAPFTGPIAILIGHDSQSAAEHLTFFFKNGGYAKLVGRASSGANGNITGLQLAAGIGFTFTGMEVRHPGGGRFHGLGLQPDVVVEPTRADITAGKDTVLVRGIDVVK